MQVFENTVIYILDMPIVQGFLDGMQSMRGGRYPTDV
jgi:hypothetical protein